MHFGDFVDYDSDESSSESDEWPCIRCKKNRDARKHKMRNIWGTDFICEKCIKVVSENLPCLKEVMKKIGELFDEEILKYL